MQWIDGALLIGLLVQSTKLGDLFISIQQKKIIEEKVESLLLKIEYSKPLDKYYKVIEEARFKRILNVLLIFIVGLFVLYLFFSSPEYETSKTDNNYLIALTLACSIIFLIGYRAFQIYGFKVLNWMIKEKSWSTFIIKYILFSITIATLLISLVLFNDRYTFHIIFIVLFTFGVFLVIFSIFFVSTLIITYYFTLVLIEMVLTFLRWLLWRITEYNKGAVAAITLLITVALGIVKIIGS